MPDLDLNAIKAHHERTLADDDQLTISEHERGLLLAEVERLREQITNATDAMSEYGRNAVAVAGILEDGINADHMLAVAEINGLQDAVKHHMAALAAASERRDYFAARCEQQERDHAQQTERLKAAEDVCVMFGWSPVTNSPRGKAASMLWNRWADIVEDDFKDPEAHPDLSKEVVAKLARQYDDKRAAVLARLRGEHQ